MSEIRVSLVALWCCRDWLKTCMSGHATPNPAVQAMGIQKYVFFSIHNCEKHPEVPLMQMKTCTEKYLADSGLNFTIFRLCGFMQVCIAFPLRCAAFYPYLFSRLDDCADQHICTMHAHYIV